MPAECRSLEPLGFVLQGLTVRQFGWSNIANHWMSGYDNSTSNHVFNGSPIPGVSSGTAQTFRASHNDVRINPSTGVGHTAYPNHAFSYTAASPITYTGYRWYIWAATFDENSRTLAVYQNGNLVGQAMTLGTPSNGAVFLGGVPVYQNGVPNVSNGQPLLYVLEASIYSTALSNADIVALRTQLAQKYSTIAFD